MMPIYQFDCYKTAIQKIVEYKKMFDSDCSYSSIAKDIGVQRSYFSNVLQGKANFNSDQLHDIGEKLNLDEKSIEYLLLLLDEDRCSSNSRRKKISEKIKKLRNEYYNVSSVLNSKDLTKELNQDLIIEYYTNPIIFLTHIFLSIPLYQSNILLLTQKLSCSSHDIEKAISKLLKFGLIKSNNGKYKAVDVNVHLDGERHEHLSLLHAMSFRVKAMEHNQFSIDSDDQYFTTSFSASRDIMQDIKIHWLDFLKKVENLVSNSLSEEVYQLNFDFFRY